MVKKGVLFKLNLTSTFFQAAFEIPHQYNPCKYLLVAWRWIPLSYVSSTRHYLSPNAAPRLQGHRFWEHPSGRCHGTACRIFRIWHWLRHRLHWWCLMRTQAQPERWFLQYSSIISLGYWHGCFQVGKGKAKQAATAKCGKLSHRSRLDHFKIYRPANCFLQSRLCSFSLSYPYILPDLINALCGNPSGGSPLARQ